MGWEMGERLPEQPDASPLLGLVLRGKSYQGVFEYTVEHESSAGLRATKTVNGQEQIFYQILPLKSLSGQIGYASLVVAGSVGVWQGWLPDLSVSAWAVFQQGELWRCFSAQFQHGDSRHLLNNLLPLVGLGWLLRGYFGVIAYPLMPLLLGALANALAVLTYPPETRVVGISGTVFAMAGLWAMLYVKNDVRYPRAKRVLRSLGFLLILFFPLSLDPRVADRVHVLGALLGLLVGFVGWGGIRPERPNSRSSSSERVRAL